MTNPLHKRPWLMVVLAFAVLLGAWAVFFTIASRNNPQTVPLEATPAKP